jgi:hypothetical protein
MATLQQNKVWLEKIKKGLMKGYFISYEIEVLGSGKMLIVQNREGRMHSFRVHSESGHDLGTFTFKEEDGFCEIYPAKGASDRKFVEKERIEAINNKYEHGVIEYLTIKMVTLHKFYGGKF